MRHQPTDAEAALWKQLRAGHFSRFKFKRQQPLGTYIVDFVCFEKRLVVEVDGAQHECTVDAQRTQWLNDQGLRVLRVWNNEVLATQEDVLNAILRALAATSPSPQPLSREGRGAKSG